MGLPSVLLVGTGGYAAYYVRDLLAMKASDTINFMGAVDPCADSNPCAASLSEAGVRIFAHSDEFYSLGEQVDLVVIASPIHTHYAYVVEAIEHGANVLCEKPVVLDLEQLADLQRRQRESGLFIAVGYQQCFAPGTLALKADIASGLFGRAIRMKALQFMRRGDAYYGRNNWAGKLSCGGQPIYDSPVSNACAHHMQTMLFLLGPTPGETVGVDSVEGVLYRTRPDIETYDASALKVNTSGGTEIWYYTGHSVAEKRVGPIGEYEFERAHLFFEDGVVTAHLENGGTRSYGVAIGSEGMYKLKRSIECVQNQERPVCTIDSVASHVQVVLKAQELETVTSFGCAYTMLDGDGTYVSPGLLPAFQLAYEGYEFPVCAPNNRA